LGRATALQLNRKYETALADCDRVLALDPKNIGVLCLRSCIWDALGNFDRALADVSEFIRQSPNSFPGYHNRAKLWEKKGFIDKALADYTQSIKLAPDLPQTYLREPVWAKRARKQNRRGPAYGTSGRKLGRRQR
jgi:tetratricopeptide (TPR) repeat protein